jgi:hypothetical protein
MTATNQTPDKATEAKVEPLPLEVQNANNIIALGQRIMMEIETVFGNAGPESFRLKLFEIALTQNSRHIHYLEEDAIKNAPKLSPIEKALRNGQLATPLEASPKQLTYIRGLLSRHGELQKDVDGLMLLWGVDCSKIKKGQATAIIDYLLEMTGEKADGNGASNGNK